MVLTSSKEPPLIIRFSSPANVIPQSVAKFNRLSITAFVIPNDDQSLDVEAFQLLLDTIKKDMAEKFEESDCLPRYLMSHSELRGSGWHGTISNMGELRRLSGMKHPREDGMDISDLLAFTSAPSASLTWFGQI